MLTSEDGCLTLVDPWLKYTPLIILMVIGLFIAFYGKKGFFAMRPVMCICMVLPLFMFTFTAFFVSYTGRTYILWGGLIFGLLLGMIVAYIFKSRFELSIKVLCACVGFVIGLYIWLEAISNTANWKTLVFAVVCSVAFTFLGMITLRYILLTMTAIFGGFICAYCVLEYDHSLPYFVYLSVGASIAVLGFLIQFAAQRKEGSYAQFD